MLKIRYDGKNYYGLVPQPEKETIIQKIFEKYGRAKRMRVISRTDKGVSAKENYVFLEYNREIEFEIGKLNEDIEILDVIPLKKLIKPSEIVIGKMYRYSIDKNLSKKIVFIPKYLRNDETIILRKNKEILIEENKDAIEILRNVILGNKSFHNFSIGKVENPFCNIKKFEFEDNGKIISILIEGNRFLQQMVRKIVTFSLSVYYSIFPIKYIDLVFSPKWILDPKPQSAPPENLILEKIFIDWNKLSKYIESGRN